LPCPSSGWATDRAELGELPPHGPALFRQRLANHRIDQLRQAATRNDMTAPPTDDSILKRFKAALDELYGDRIDRVVFFGSRARGDARDDSDYDVAVLLKTLPAH
jgi:hypothetical protein